MRERRSPCSTQTAPAPVAMSIGDVAQRDRRAGLPRVEVDARDRAAPRGSAPIPRSSPTARLLGAVGVSMKDANSASAAPMAATPLACGGALPSSSPPSAARTAATVATASSRPPASSSRPWRRRAGSAARRGRRARLEAERAGGRVDQLGAASVAILAVLGERLADAPDPASGGRAAKPAPPACAPRASPPRWRAGTAPCPTGTRRARSRARSSRCARPWGRRGSAPAPGSRACRPPGRCRSRCRRAAW